MTWRLTESVKPFVPCLHAAEGCVWTATVVGELPRQTLICMCVESTLPTRRRTLIQPRLDLKRPRICRCSWMLLSMNVRIALIVDGAFSSAPRGWAVPEPGGMPRQPWKGLSTDSVCNTIPCQSREKTALRGFRRLGGLDMG